MDFSLSNEHRMLRDSLRGLLGRHRDPALWDPLAEAGAMGALLREAAGGFDGSGAVIALIFEQLGRAGASLPLIDSVLIGGGVLAKAGGHDDLVEAVAAGRARLAFADAEPGTRYDRDLTMTVSRDRRTGCQTMVTGAEEADAILVSTAEGQWLVAAGAPGVTRHGYTMLDGNRGADLDFDATPATRLGTLADIGTVLARGVLAHSAKGLGGIEATQRLTLNYLKTRKQFGRALFEFQALATAWPTWRSRSAGAASTCPARLTTAERACSTAMYRRARR